jgi:two-component system sensor histidine kinase HupT/HoxJ
VAADAREGAERLERIVRDLSSLSRGGSELLLGSTDLVALARTAARVAGTRNAAIPVRVEGEASLLATCDGGRVEQILVNLVANAIDAVEARKDRLADAGVRVIVGSDGRNAVLDVVDSGVGMPRGLRSRLFGAFVTTKGHNGTGLGLFLSRSFAQAHGGDLSVADTGPTGTTLRLTLPLRPAAAATGPAIAVPEPAA